MGTLTAPPNRRFLTRIRNGKMGGVVLLGNGWLTRHTAETVTAELQNAACTRGEPLLIAVDQEGGIVRRLAWAPPTEAPDEMTSPAVARNQAAGVSRFSMRYHVLPPKYSSRFITRCQPFRMNSPSSRRLSVQNSAK